jgi:phage terminase large subunit-like protein
LTISVLAAPHVPLLGDQRPRLESFPRADDWSQGEDAVELARQAGLVLDDWQRYVLRQALATRGKKWAAFEVCLILARQNGKGAVLEALELAALFLFDDVQLILHSAHKFDTAADAFRRILGLIEANPDFACEVKKVIRSHGSESIELKNGKRLRFIARSSGAGRGFAADLVILDEAYDISEDSMASMLPTLSTRPNPQVWYTSTAGDQGSVQLGRVRDRGLRGDDRSLAFFEWSVDPLNYDPGDPVCWAQANPGLWIRITADYIALEQAALNPEAFARERLSVGDYPVDGGAWETIRADAWAACAREAART